MIEAAQGVKANLFLFISVVVALFFMSLFSLIIAFPLNNTLSSVNEDLSWVTVRIRILEVIVFIASMVLLFSEIILYYPVLLFGLIIYSIHLIISGYLVFKSGFLNRITGVSLIIGGLLGYMTESLNQILLPGIILFSPFGVLLAIITEIAFAFVLIITALRITPDLSDTRTNVIKILEDLGEATITEIIDEASRVSNECQDRVPKTLIALEQDEIVTKRFSKEKKGYIWTLDS
jgi:hypothetical protein